MTMTETDLRAIDSIERGVLSAAQLRHAVTLGWIDATREITPQQFQPASLDLRLGAKAYRLRSSFLPGASSTVEERLADLQMGPPLDLGGKRPAVLERGRPYLIQLAERLSLPAGMRARANPRSSTGRLDLFTRVITDQGSQFDDVRDGYKGPLWLEVYSNSFTVSVREGLALAQLRLLSGATGMGDRDVHQLHATHGLLYSPGSEPRQPVPRLAVSNGSVLVGVSLEAGLHVGWKARRDSGLLDLQKEGFHAPKDFWLPVLADSKGRLVLEPEDFYLLISREYVSVPEGVAAEMIAYDPTNGELRTHYAGFFDPGFGMTSGGGTRAVLEVRAHDVPFMLENGQPIARLAYERMSEVPESLYGDAQFGSHFQGQEVFGALSRQFKTPDPWSGLPFGTGIGH